MLLLLLLLLQFNAMQCNVFVPTLVPLQVKKTFDDSFKAAQDPETLHKYASHKQVPENNWQGFKSWDR
jgi:hypothetical protein